MHSFLIILLRLFAITKKFYDNDETLRFFIVKNEFYPKTISDCLHSLSIVFI